METAAEQVTKTFFDIYDANGTIKPIADLIGNVDFEPVIPMTLMEAFYTIVSFGFILSIVVSGLLIIPKNKDLVQRMIKEEMGDKSKSNPKSKTSNVDEKVELKKN
ncbi:hypothetical protein BB560_000508 [Smittium megazygosporum]|uniref:Uncharacterized protein n=1 Tax=Smittium megazygosporum TaxID=133381 RepID=A0A2T9ZK73_9FUNG|nr:hypothetical protein BB560_000508 [Smittium megazygosporum]